MSAGKPLKIKVGAKIKELRLKKGLTQLELGNLLGKKDNTITVWEKGSSSPDIDSIAMLCKIFEVSANELMCWKGTEADEPEEIEMKIYDEPSAAGWGNYLTGEDSYEIMKFLADDVPYNAAFGVRIQGDSMEPRIMDGNIVWVQEKLQLESGQVGIFILNGAAYCKKLFINHIKKRVELVSFNKAYRNIVVKHSDEFRTVGKVLL